MPATFAWAANARSFDHFTSSAVSGLPLGKTSPSLRTSVHTRPSSSGVHDSAIEGTMLVVSSTGAPSISVTP